MGTTRFDNTFDEMLDGKNFEGVNALEYLAVDFTDDELQTLSKFEMIQLFTKAFVLICVQQNENIETSQKLAERYKLLSKHYEIYPDLVLISKSEQHVESIKIQAEMRKNGAEDLKKLIKKIPIIMKRSHSESSSDGGNSRSANDKRHQDMLKIKDEYVKKWDEGYRFPRGRLAEFYNEMGKSYQLCPSSIKNAIEKHRKKLGHTNK